MDEKTANQLASILGGESWQSGGGMYLVTITRDNGSLIVLSGESICEYESAEAFDAGLAATTIPLEIPETDDLYVIVDPQGNIYYLDDRAERGWRFEEDAHREARAWQSRGEGPFSVIRQSELPA